MKQPNFWYRSVGPLTICLAPLSFIWQLATYFRQMLASTTSLKIPIICVGSLNIGGSGKTPFVIALAQRLIDANINIHIISRGYKGSIAGPIKVDTQKHSASDVGDEALLLAAFAPTWVAKNRVTGAELASHSGADIIVLDDGHQSPYLSRDLSIIVVDAKRGFGNSMTIPAGPLREPVRTGLSRADMLLIVGNQTECAQFRKSRNARESIPQINAHLELLDTGIDWRKMTVFGFAGIGHPEKFEATLHKIGANVAGFKPLSDHQLLDEKLLARLANDANKYSAQLVTTEKDATRLPTSWKPRVLAVPVRMKLDCWKFIDSQLAELGIDLQ